MGNGTEQQPSPLISSRHTCSQDRSMLQLTEHTKSEPKYLTASQQRKLKDWFRADFEPADETGKVHVIPGSRVGGATIDGLKVSVAPKMPIHRLLMILAETDRKSVV